MYRDHTHIKSRLCTNPKKLDSTNHHFFRFEFLCESILVIKFTNPKIANFMSKFFEFIII